MLFTAVLLSVPVSEAQGIETVGWGETLRGSLDKVVERGYSFCLPQVLFLDLWRRSLTAA